MRINVERIRNNLSTVGDIGKNSSGGITRLGFSTEYYEAIRKLSKLFEDQGLSVEIDPIGNLIGRREGKYDLASIMIGSHFDTVKNGGFLDGALGVFAALECVSTLNENNIETNHPLEIVAFNAEEGSEMGGTFGSRVMFGRQNLEEESLSNKLNNYNLKIEDLKKSIKDTTKIKLFLELHIEQGGFLEKNKLTIGVVSGIAGITRYGITIKGEANHAGTTPMDMRKDALTMAAKLLVKIDEISKEIGRPFVSTVGQMIIKPGSVNVIPGEVYLVLELRDMEKNNIERAIKEIKNYTDKLKEYQFNYELLIDKANVETDKEITKTIKKICENNKVAHEIMVSGAGHDAKEIASKIPVGMIFVPSKDGKSHCPEEYTSWEDIEVGVQVLYETILKLDENK